MDSSLGKSFPWIDTPDSKTYKYSKRKRQTLLYRIAAVTAVLALVYLFTQHNNAATPTTPAAHADLAWQASEQTLRTEKMGLDHVYSAGDVHDTDLAAKGAKTAVKNTAGKTKSAAPLSRPLDPVSGSAVVNEGRPVSPDALPGRPVPARSSPVSSVSRPAALRPAASHSAASFSTEVSSEDAHHLNAGLIRVLASIPDEIHARELLRPIAGTGKERLRETGLRARAFKQLLEPWEALHVVHTPTSSHVRDDIVTYLRKAADVSAISTTLTRADMIHTYETYRYFLTQLSSLLFPWTAPYFADHMSLHAHLRHGDRGIVLSGGDDQVQFMLTGAKSIRALGCDLPIEVMYLGDEDLGEDSRELLEAIPNVITRDMAQMVSDKGWELKGWAGKPFAILLSSFREVIFIDADALFFKSPEVLFADPGYEETGALFFRDRLMFPESKKKWLQQILPRPISKSVHASRFWTGESGHMQESGVVVVDTYRHFLALLMVTRMNGPDRDGNKDKGVVGIYDMVYGDKETFWLGWELVGDVDYTFHPGDAGNMGVAMTDYAEKKKIKDEEKKKKAEEKKAEEKKAEEKKAEEKKVEDKKAEDKKADEKKAEEKKTEDKKAEEKKAEDKKAEEKKAEEKKAQDKKAEETKAEEKKAADKKAEEAIAADKKKQAEDKKKAEETAAAAKKAASDTDKTLKKRSLTVEDEDASTTDPEAADEPAPPASVKKYEDLEPEQDDPAGASAKSYEDSEPESADPADASAKGYEDVDVDSDGDDDTTAVDDADDDDEPALEADEDALPPTLAALAAATTSRAGARVGELLPPAAPSNANYTICAPQLLHLDRDGAPLWFNGWILQNKFEGKSAPLSKFDSYMIEKRADTGKTGEWSLEESNMCCLMSDVVRRFTREEKKVLGQIVGIASSVGAVNVR